jgi:hypothetical protein
VATHGLHHAPEVRLQRSGRLLHPRDNMPDYGRDLASLTGRAMLALCADVDAGQKLGLLVAMVQRGIDVFWTIPAGWHCGPDGGHGSGRKVVVILAGLMLAPEMLGVNEWCLTSPHPTQRSHRAIFGEDGQTYYTSDGVAAWAHNALDIPQTEEDWYASPYRRCCTANAWPGQLLAMRAMGGMRAWEWPALFDYQDRYVRTLTAENDANEWKDWNYPTQWNEWQRLRKTDLAGIRTIGLPEAGKPSLRVTIPPQAGLSWTVHLDAGKPGAFPGLLVRSAKTIVRPDNRWGPFETKGLVFVDVADYQVSVPVDSGADGTVGVTLAAAEDVGGSTNTQQGVLLTAAGREVSKAAEVTNKKAPEAATTPSV